MFFFQNADEQKNRSFRNRWLMYISSAKSPAQYITLPKDISDQRICALWTERRLNLLNGPMELQR